MPEPTQLPTPDQTPAKESDPATADSAPSKPPTTATTTTTKKRPQQPVRTDTDFSSTTDMADSDNDPGYRSRSRSQSRRRRRQNQRQRQQAASKADSGQDGASAQSMASINEGDELDPEPQTQPRQPGQRLRNPHPSDVTEMQPFERIKPPSQSMNGPVTYARAMRGEIPMRGAPPSQPIETTQGVDAKASGQSDLMEQDGLKLRLELNLDIEVELKASIHGDLTLALL